MINEEKRRVKIRLNEAGRLYLHFWWRGKPCKIYTGRDDTADNRNWCNRWATLIESEMHLGSVDIERYRTQIGERRQRLAATTKAADEMTFLELGEGLWYASKRAASETKAKEYLGDLHIVAGTEIEVDEKK
jgi:hypothetical protein